jgi:predicted transcriptional regulator
MTSLREVQAACALLAWSQDDLARASGVRKGAIAKLGEAPDDLPGDSAVLSKLVSALERAGIAFIEDGAVVGGGPGVRLKVPIATQV